METKLNSMGLLISHRLAPKAMTTSKMQRDNKATQLVRCTSLASRTTTTRFSTSLTLYVGSYSRRTCRTRNKLARPSYDPVYVVLLTVPDELLGTPSLRTPNLFTKFRQNLFTIFSHLGYKRIGP